jgi:hypothetical protein
LKRTFVLFIALLALGSCQREADDGLFKLTGRIFVFNYRVSEASYMVTIEQTGIIPGGLFVVAAFEDPAGGPPIEIVRPAWPKLKRVALASPPIRCVKAGKPYAVTITIKDAAGTALQTLETTVTSNIDQSVLAAKPLVVGPVYVPNREVYTSDGPDFSPDPNCPA